MIPDYSVLSGCSLFRSIHTDDMNSLLSCIQAYTKQFEENDFIFLQGDTVHAVGVVLSGSLELIKENAAGVRHILDFLGPSNLFAEGIVCTRNRISPVSVRVKEASTILFIPYERILHTCGNSCSFHLQIIQNMMLLLGEKNMILNRKIELLTIKGMREKIAVYLLQESKKHEEQTFSIIPNRNELADFLNVSRPSMCRELGRMKDLGMIDYYQNSFRILDFEALSDCISQD